MNPSGGTINFPAIKASLTKLLIMVSDICVCSLDVRKRSIICGPSDKSVGYLTDIMHVSPQAMLFMRYIRKHLEQIAEAA